MSIDRIKMLGEGPYPLPMEHFIKKVDICMDTDVCVIVSGSTIDFPEKAQHVHDSYEFTIPYTVMPYLQLGKDHYVGEKDKIYPINSGQAHGPYGSMFNTHLLSLNIDSDFLNEIAFSIYGKSNVYFKQGNYSFGNDLKALIKMFVEEYRDSRPGRKLTLKCLSTQIAVHMFRQIDSNMPFLFSSDCNTAKKNIDRAIEYLRNQYDGKYSLDETAGMAHLSPYHFIKVFKSYTGKTPYEYLMHVKIEKAKELLTAHNLSITEICFMCGFNNPSNFATLFKRKVGVTPSQYRKIITNG